MRYHAAGKKYFPELKLTRRFWIAGLLLIALSVPFAAGTGRVFFYSVKDQSEINQDSGYALQIPTSFSGLNAGFALPHQNRPGDSFWLHLSLSSRPETGSGPYTLKIKKIAIRDENGPVFLEARLSANPDFARAVHYEEGGLTGLRPFTFDQVFVAGIPFELSPAPRYLFLDYDVTLRNKDGKEEALQGTLDLQRAVKHRFRLPL